VSKPLKNKQRDVALVNKAILGDQKAFSDLMTFYWPTIEGFFAMKLSSKEDVEDLSIATFTKAFDKIKSYNSSYAFSTWIQTIATNSLIDFFRKKEQKTISIDADVKNEKGNPHEIEDLDTNPELNFIQQQKNNQLFSLLEKLKPHYRELIVLRYLEELSYDEIAQKLNIPLGSVKAKLFRARDLLLKILKPQENEF
jgi:RNA polymerase sigma-70 factor (ECF subfamily)